MSKNKPDQQTAHPINKQRIKKILVTRTQGLGDMICFIPTLRGLREALPQAHITVFAGRPAGRHVAEQSTYADRIIYRDIEVKTSLWEKLRFVIVLRKERFDLTVASSQEVGFALKAFLSGARYRIGFREYRSQRLRSCDRFWFLNTVSLTYRKGEHEVEANLRLLEALGIRASSTSLQIPLDDQSRLFADGIFRDYHLRGRTVVVVSPSAKRSAKIWPVENYAALAKHLVNNLGLKVLLVGGAEHIAISERLQELGGGSLIDLTGKTNLKELMALLSRSNLYIGNDSGTTHVAAAANIPIVVLYGPGDENQFRPYCDNYLLINKRVDCAPCDHDSCASMKCMKSITVKEVIEAAEGLLQRSRIHRP